MVGAGRSRGCGGVGRKGGTSSARDEGRPSARRMQCSSARRAGGGGKLGGEARGAVRALARASAAMACRPARSQRAETVPVGGQQRRARVEADLPRHHVGVAAEPRVLVRVGHDERLRRGAAESPAAERIVPGKRALLRRRAAEGGGEGGGAGVPGGPRTRAGVRRGLGARPRRAAPGAPPLQRPGPEPGPKPSPNTCAHLEVLGLLDVYLAVAKERCVLRRGAVQRGVAMWVWVRGAGVRPLHASGRQPSPRPASIWAAPLPLPLPPFSRAHR